MRGSKAGAALAVLVLAAGGSASADVIYLHCGGAEPERAVPKAWVIDTVAASVKPIGSNFVGSFRSAKVTETGISAQLTTDGGNVIRFDLNRVSGDLEFSIIRFDADRRVANGLPAVGRLHCVAMERPRV